MYSDYRHIAASRRGRILTLTLDNPPLNAVNRALVELAFLYVAESFEATCTETISFAPPANALS